LTDELLTASEYEGLLGDANPKNVDL
jgi:hypothetical protein